MSKHPLIEKIELRWPTKRREELTIVIGCSGGADSTALLLAMKQLCPPTTTIFAAHLNHQLRGAESEADASFVKVLCERLGVVCLSQSRATSPQAIDDEASLREHRYAFLSDTALSLGARYVVTAHHADDQVETFLFNLFRGTGLAGLRGSLPFRDLVDDLVLARPMIDCTRVEIHDFLAQCNQSYRLDSSNRSNEYSRNRIRNIIIPFIEAQLQRDIRSSIANASRSIAELDLDLSARAQVVLNRWTIKSKDVNGKVGFLVCCQLLEDYSWNVMQRVLSIQWKTLHWPEAELTREHWNYLRRLIEDRHSKPHHQLPGNILVSRQTNLDLGLFRS